MSGDTPSHIGSLSPDGKWRWDGESWQPTLAFSVDRAGPRWLSLELKTRATWLTLAGALIVGLLADQALRAGTFGLAASLSVAVAALALWFAGRLLTLESRLLAGAAVMFAAWLAVRASPWLLWPDLAMSFALLALAASLAFRGSLLDMGIAEAGARSLHTFFHGAAGAGFAIQPLARVRTRLGLVAPLFRRPAHRRADRSPAGRIARGRGPGIRVLLQPPPRRGPACAGRRVRRGRIPGSGRPAPAGGGRSGSARGRPDVAARVDRRAGRPCGARRNFFRLRPGTGHLRHWSRRRHLAFGRGHLRRLRSLGILPAAVGRRDHRSDSHPLQPHHRPDRAHDQARLRSPGADRDRADSAHRRRRLPAPEPLRGCLRLHDAAPVQPHLRGVDRGGLPTAGGGHGRRNSAAQMVCRRDVHLRHGRAPGPEPGEPGSDRGRAERQPRADHT